MSASHRVRVFTFKEGLLSRVAHDLRLHVERFAIEREGTREGEDVVARFDADSLAVDGVMKDGRLDPEGLGRRDRAKVERTIEAEILRARRFPTIEFRGRVTAGEDDTLRAEGELSLVGVRRPLVIEARRAGERVNAVVTLRPSEFGIAPYKTLAGAIRLQDRVRVELDLEAAALGL
jgi:polyisoprenoid-binding protein YceI